jgi:hypothetical protein
MEMEGTILQNVFVVFLCSWREVNETENLQLYWASVTLWFIYVLTYVSMYLIN